MHTTIRHTLNTNPATFWELFFDEEFNREQFKRLKFDDWTQLAFERKPDGSIVRKTRNSPPAKIPGPVQKALGNVTSYIEDGVYNPATGKFSFTAQAPGADKVKTQGEVWVEPRGEAQVERIASIEISANVRFVGGMIEGFIEQQTRRFYEKGAEFTNRWIADKGL